MVEALVKNPSAALAELVANPARRVELVAAVERAVEESFREDARRAGRAVGRTGREEKRRAHLCLDLFERTYEAGWSPVHFRDRIRAALRHELDHGPGSYDPSAERLVWTPS